MSEINLTLAVNTRAIRVETFDVYLDSHECFKIGDKKKFRFNFLEHKDFDEFEAVVIWKGRSAGRDYVTFRSVR